MVLHFYSLSFQRTFQYAECFTFSTSFFFPPLYCRQTVTMETSTGLSVTESLIQVHATLTGGLLTWRLSAQLILQQTQKQGAGAFQVVLRVVSDARRQQGEAQGQGGGGGRPAGAQGRPWLPGYPAAQGHLCKYCEGGVIPCSDGKGGVLVLCCYSDQLVMQTNPLLLFLSVAVPHKGGARAGPGGLPSTQHWTNPSQCPFSEEA